MRYMVMHKVDANMEAGGPPPRKVIEEMGAFVGKAIKDGVFKDGAGLHPSAKRVRIQLRGGKRTVTKGPYPGGNELLASFALIHAASMDHAVEIATRVAGAIGDVEIEIGPVVEGWDLRGAPRPEGTPHRFLLLRKGDAATESGAAPSPAVAHVLEELTKEGIVQSTTALAPSKKGTRLSVARTWTDGPFTESKELVAGFSIIEVPTVADAKAWAEAYGAILVDCEVDVREVV